MVEHNVPVPGLRLGRIHAHRPEVVHEALQVLADLFETRPAGGTLDEALEEAAEHELEGVALHQNVRAEHAAGVLLHDFRILRDSKTQLERKSVYDVC